MLENIKMVLGLPNEDLSKDNLINYHIKVYTNQVLIYCGLDTLPEALNSVVEALVLDRMSFGNQGKVKKKKIDDFEVEFAVDSVTSDLDPYKTILDKFKGKKVKFV